MKIGLMGFEFKSANKGCEALVYSFLSIVGKIINEELVVYNLSGTELGEVPTCFSKIQFVNILPKLKDLKFKYIRVLLSCDVIFDVTMGDSFSDIYSKKYYDYLIKHKYIASFINRRYVLLPQTYGPFEHEDSSTKAKKVFNKAYKIFCRDEMSQQLLEKDFGIYDSVLVSDLAFVLPYDKKAYQFSNKEKIGLNVSGLLYKGGFHTKNQFGLSLNYLELLDSLLDVLSRKYEVHLIPHVVDQSQDSYDDDYKICKILHEKYVNTILAPAFDTPIQAKSYISNMDIFIGSRMHSTIASFSSDVVTIPISYSRKFEGLFNSINYPCVINAKKESTESAFNLVIQYIEDRGRLAEMQKESKGIIEKKIALFEKSISEIMKEA